LARGSVAVTTAFFLMIVGCTTRHPLTKMAQAPSANPRLLAVYMPWFGDHSHMDVGYSSDDPAVLRQQIKQARERGIYAFVVDWNGQRNPYSDHNFALMQQQASDTRFYVALLYNEAEEDDAEQATDDALAAFQRAYTTYIGPQARYHDAYLTYQSRPLVFIFPKSGRTDWNRVRQELNQWQEPPLLIYKDQPPAQYASDFAGSYAWVQPGAPGWKPDGSNWGESYLQNFYRTMSEKYRDKIAVGGAWPAFNDSHAAWSLNRHMDARCGQTFENTLQLYHKYYDDSRPLPFLLIETWNDYEEGTAIERMNTMTAKWALPQTIPHEPRPEFHQMLHAAFAVGSRP
jgi:hypothetical protein